MNFWDTFYNLCKSRGKSPNGLAKELGISSGAITWWKKGRVPHRDTLDILTSYFNVSEGYLLGYEKPVVEGAALEKENSPDELKLTEGEELLLQLFRQVPVNQQALVLQMIKAALNNL